MAFQPGGEQSWDVPRRCVWDGEAGSLREWKRNFAWWLESQDLAAQFTKEGHFRYSIAARVVNAHRGAPLMKLRSLGVDAFRPKPGVYGDGEGTL